ncbi:hypothetical protein KQI86_19580 [Clostridium sp. MSJ-11]|uniref:Na+-translocating membrane potential-generating system MpsC domain-containing protein n=1 Tax=Clostridium mobile TaxID=2841512 RepID=A0ABS6EQ34_9CLOT|nr:hypothetical protein [Clostridium mobile]MBU5486505.1 hypothetical protein [Clostridium mobile]
MSNSKQKILRIIDELVTICYSINCKKFNVNVELLDDKCILHLKGYVDSIDIKKIDDIEKSLNVPRAHELEEYYWNLAGNDLSNTELNLVGMMIDESTVSYNKKDKIFEIKLTRLK